MAYRTNLDWIVTGEPLSAATLNRVPGQLKTNVDYLKTIVDNLDAGSAIYAQDVTVKSDVLVGQPVYYSNTNDRFELAQAITGKSDCVGICYSKSGSTTGTLLLGGRVNLSMSNAITGTPTPGRYFLSAADPGKLVSSRPATIQVSVLIIDESNNIVVFPHENVSIAGTTGATGATGAAGPVGATGATGAVGPASYLLRHKASTSWHIAGQFSNVALTEISPAVDTLVAIPIDVMQGGTLDRIAVEVTQAGTAGSDVRIGLYDSTSTATGNLYPNARIMSDLGGLNCTVAGIKSITISQAITANTLIWAVINCGVAAPALRALLSDALRPVLGVDEVASVFTNPGYAYSVSSTYGALPATFPGSATVVRSGSVPAIMFRFSA